jgi:hypothetical protein
MNKQHSRPIFENADYNNFKYRAINYFQLKTPTHQINFFVPFDLGVTCSCLVTIFDIEKGMQTYEKVETLLTCPASYHPTMMNALDSGISLALRTENLTITVLPKKPPQHEVYEITVKAPSIQLDFFGEVDPTKTDGYIISIPLSEDQTHYFVANKKLGMPMTNTKLQYKG